MKKIIKKNLLYYIPLVVMFIINIVITWFFNEHIYKLGIDEPKEYERLSMKLYKVAGLAALCVGTVCALFSIFPSNTFVNNALNIFTVYIIIAIAFNHLILLPMIITTYIFCKKHL